MTYVPEAGSVIYQSTKAVAHAPPIIQSPAYDDIPQPSPEDFIADPIYPLDAYS
ncbi:MAG: hypothetical protein JRG88_06385 [Deltaproteobacteria bacterium]|nr:hypothetical protein [Deltaproteobacteria bacterium]